MKKFLIITMLLAPVCYAASEKRDLADESRLSDYESDNSEYGDLTEKHRLKALRVLQQEEQGLEVAFADWRFEMGYDSEDPDNSPDITAYEEYKNFTKTLEVNRQAQEKFYQEDERSLQPRVSVLLKRNSRKPLLLKPIAEHPVEEAPARTLTPEEKKQEEELEDLIAMLCPKAD